MELIKCCASFVNDSTPKTCTSLSWWVAETLEAQAVSMGTGVLARWPSSVAVDAESDGVLGWGTAVRVPHLSKLTVREL